MTRERHARLQAVFLGASQRVGDERVRYLDEECAGDPELRREVEELLAFHTTAAVSGAGVSGQFDSAEVGVGTIIDGKIRIESVIGEGGMGTVFRGVQLALERPVAVKIIRPVLVAVPGVIERLRREALAIARLRHPNVISIYDFHASPDMGAYLVMELIEGEPLGETVAREGRLRTPLAVTIVQQICAAVQAAHDVGVVHRDLKPQNILLESPATSPCVKVLDFGIAKLIEDSATGNSLTGEGALLGTPTYMSPEQASGMPADARSDIYSIGCILYELVTGEPPFPGHNIARLLVNHVSTPPVPPSQRARGVAPWLDPVVLKALAKEPDERYQSPSAMASALADGLREVTSPRAIGRAEAGAPARVTAPPRPSTTASGSIHDRETVLDAARTTNNLPTLPTSFVGRERVVADVVDALESSRLVTLTGPGGIGKTRIAFRAASLLLGAGPDGVWFVDLSQVADPAGVARAVAATFEVRADSDADAVAAVVRRLEPLNALLVLDNCEHVVAAAGVLLGELLGGCPRLRALATSREPLHVEGESVYPVPPLAPPGGDDPIRGEDVQLFVARAQLVSSSFQPAAGDLAEIAEICAHLDGLPLAIELAAARTRILTVHQIHERLRDRLKLLRSGEDATRHGSLAAALDWSYDLLGPAERLLFDRLSVFAAGFTIDAIEAVCTGDDLDAEDTLDILAGLVDKSLVAVSHTGREAHYSLLETIRAYASRKLADRGEAERLRARHHDYYLALAEAGAREMKGREGAAWGARLAEEIDNLRAALAWSRDEADSGLPLVRLANALHVFFYERGYLAEGREWLEAAIARIDDATPAAMQTEALTGAGNLAHDQGDLEAARVHHERALEIHRRQGETGGVATALHNIGNILMLRGDYAAAREHFEESGRILAGGGRPQNVALSLFSQGCLAAETGDWERARALVAEAEALFTSIDYAYGLSLVRTSQAYMAMMQGDLDAAGSLLDRALAASRQVENRHNVTSVTLFHGNVARLGGRLAEAETRATAALDEFRAIGDRDCSSAALLCLARTARAASRLDRAASRLAESLALRSQLGMKKGLAECFEEAAAIALAGGEADAAARLLGAAAALRGRIGAPVAPVDAPALEAAREAAMSALGAEAFAAATAAGEGLDLPAARDLARAAVAQR